MRHYPLLPKPLIGLNGPLHIVGPVLTTSCLCGTYLGWLCRHGSCPISAFVARPRTCRNRTTICSRFASPRGQPRHALSCTLPADARLCRIRLRYYLHIPEISIVLGGERCLGVSWRWRRTVSRPRRYLVNGTERGIPSPLLPCRANSTALVALFPWLFNSSFPSSAIHVVVRASS